MNVSASMLRIMLLLLPGFIALKIYRLLRGRVPQKDWEDLISILVFSVLSYTILAFFEALQIGWADGSFQFGLNSLHATTFQALFDEKMTINWDEVFRSTFAGVVLAYGASYLYQFKLINKFGRAIKATKQFGDEDVWSYLHNSPNIEWVIVRDHKVNLYYLGWIMAFSEPNQKRELLMGDVSVYNEEGLLCYETDSLYISRDYSDLSIEIPLCERKEGSG